MERTIIRYTLYERKDDKLVICCSGEIYSKDIGALWIIVRSAKERGRIVVVDEILFY